MYPSRVSAPYLCIHGHFYQPPRENPWLDRIDVQDSASPFHDWNERITAECYAPMRAARILDAQGRIADIVNLYSYMSFNFGPTLLAWLERHAPDTYSAILEADRESARRFGGHGSALAQAYNHPILPLASRRDKVTQVRWGIADFVHRFGRTPEGMWLPETAVDVETLEVLAEAGIRFTILAPYQATRVRRRGGAWHQVGPEGVDPRRPYLVLLPSGRNLAVFFYHGPVARAVAFERLLNSGDGFLNRLLAIAEGGGEHPLVHIATDGETYGHHHRFGEMALAWALKQAEQRRLARLTNYGEFLERHPPTWEAEIAAPTSWSCAHGVARWREDCGCRLTPGTSQAWRRPLRQTLEWLAQVVDALFEREGRRYFADPWAARDASMALHLDPRPAHRERFLAQHAGRPLPAGEQVRALQLLEMQRQAQLMFTSCGWFFDDIAGLEAVQVLLYAARAAQLAEQLSGRPLLAEVESRLAAAPGNHPEFPNGGEVWRRRVLPRVTTLSELGAQAAILTLFENGGSFAPAVAVEAVGEEATAGSARLASGRLHLTAVATGERADLGYAAVHYGDHTVLAGVRSFPGEEAWVGLAGELRETFRRGDLSAVVRWLDRTMERTATLADLPPDDRRRVLHRILATVVGDARAVYRTLYHAHAPLLTFIAEMGAPPPPELLTAAARTLADAFATELAAPAPDPQRLRAVVAEARRLGVSLDGAAGSLAFEAALIRLLDAAAAAPGVVEPLLRLQELLALLPQLPSQVNLWQLETAYHVLRQKLSKGVWGSPDPAWRSAFARLGEALRFTPLS